MRKKNKINRTFAKGEPTVTVTQHEAALAQLVQAVILFFYEGNPVAIHSLSRNAEEIISKLLSVRGEKSMWDTTLDMIKEERRNEFRQLVDTTKNALKHKVADENEIIEFPLAINDFFLLVGSHAIHTYWPEEFKKHPELLLFETWYLMNSPEILSNEHPEIIKLKEGLAETASHKMTKRQFYESYYEPATIALKDMSSNTRGRGLENHLDNM